MRGRGGRGGRGRGRDGGGRGRGRGGKRGGFSHSQNENDAFQFNDKKERKGVLAEEMMSYYRQVSATIEQGFDEDNPEIKGENGCDFFQLNLGTANSIFFRKTNID